MATEVTIYNSGTPIISGKRVQVDNAGGTIEVTNDVGVKVTKLDQEGYTFTETNGVRRIRSGINPKTGRVVHAVSKPGVDVIDALSG